jgi:CRP/FNR family cyclic AMP-dependent transcriptional regulator
MRSWFGTLLGRPHRARPAGAPAAGVAAWAPPDAVMVDWDARASEIGARGVASGPAIDRLQALWCGEHPMAALGPQAVARLERFLQFVHIAADRTLIRQHELGDFMVVLLQGGIAVDRRQPWGEQLRLAECRPGDILGEMSLLDQGSRFSACTTLTDCQVAVLSAQGLDEMMHSEPRLAAALIALLARKLSRRLRAVDVRLSDRPHQEHLHGTRSGR